MLHEAIMEAIAELTKAKKEYDQLLTQVADMLETLGKELAHD